MKKYLFLLKNTIFIFLLARVHSRARCAPCQIPYKCQFWPLFRVHDAARDILARANGYKIKNCIFFIFTMYSYLQNSQRYKHLKFCQMCPENRIFWTHSRNRGGPPLTKLAMELLQKFEKEKIFFRFFKNDRGFDIWSL